MKILKEEEIEELAALKIDTSVPTLVWGTSSVDTATYTTYYTEGLKKFYFYSPDNDGVLQEPEP